MTENDRRKIMDWLSPINQAEIHAAALRKHEPGTREWFINFREESIFENWRREPESSLWLYGDGRSKKPTQNCDFLANYHVVEPRVAASRRGIHYKFSAQAFTNIRIDARLSQNSLRAGASLLSRR